MFGTLVGKVLALFRSLWYRLVDQQKHLAMLASVASQTDHGVVITDARGQIIWVNDSFTRLSGYTLSEVKGQTPSSMLQGPATDPATVKALSKAMRTGQAISTELINYHKDGQDYWLGLTLNPIRNKQGQLIHFIALESDITQRKVREQALRTSLKDLSDVRFALDQGAIVAVTDEDGVILEASDMFCRSSGYSRSELIGQTHRLINSRYHDQAFWQQMWQTISAGKTWRGEILNKTKDGKLYWLHSTIVPFVKQAGKPTRYLTIRFDISERKRTEEALRASEATNRALLNALPDLMFRLSTAGVFIGYHAPRPNELLLPPEQFLGRRIEEVFSLELTAKLREAMRATLETGLLQLLEYTMPQGDELRDYELRMTPISSDEVLVIVRDISERKASDRLKNEFVAMVSHELRTPLTAIRGSLGLLSGGVAGTLPTQARTMIDIAYKNSERLVRLINDILDIEKIESGKMSFHCQPLELGQLLAQTIEANTAYGDQFGVSFALDAPAKVQVSADTDRMIQVFTNLLSNAVKYSPSGEVVRVWMRQRAGLVRVGVSDRGPGIPEAFRKHIFQKFAQADSSSTREKGGTGLGLSIVRAIVEHHGGTISFESELGLGTTFLVELPEWKPVLEQVVTRSAGRILVCEDDPDVAHLLKLVLERAGFAVEVVYSAEELRLCLRKDSYDVITLDIRLQHQDGVELIRELRAHEATASLPIIVVSGLVDRAREDLGDDMGGRIEWLPKPIKSATLVAAVLRAMRRTPSLTPRLLHIDSDPDIVQVVASLIGETALVTHAATVAAARAHLAESHYDLVLLDLVLPDGSGLDIVAQLQTRRPNIPTVIFSAHELDPALKSQVAASLVKSRVTNRELRDTLTRLLRAAEPDAEQDALPRSEEDL